MVDPSLMQLFIIAILALSLTQLPCSAHPHVDRDERLCEALRLSLPSNCIVGADCFGWVCLVDMFGTALTVEADLRGVCQADPKIDFAIQERLATSKEVVQRAQQQGPPPQIFESKLQRVVEGPPRGRS
eukprot:SAG25_NODE_1388_length_3144_cov_1.629885_4_plen_129_part_00